MSRTAASTDRRSASDRGKETGTARGSAGCPTRDPSDPIVSVWRAAPCLALRGHAPAAWAAPRLLARTPVPSIAPGPPPPLPPSARRRTRAREQEAAARVAAHAVVAEWAAGAGAGAGGAPHVAPDARCVAAPTRSLRPTSGTRARQISAPASGAEADAAPAQRAPALRAQVLELPAAPAARVATAPVAPPLVPPASVASETVDRRPGCRRDSSSTPRTSASCRLGGTILRSTARKMATPSWPRPRPRRPEKDRRRVGRQGRSPARGRPATAPRSSARVFRCRAPSSRPAAAHGCGTNRSGDLLFPPPALRSDPRVGSQRRWCGRRRSAGSSAAPHR